MCIYVTLRSLLASIYRPFMYGISYDLLYNLILNTVEFDWPLILNTVIQQLFESSIDLRLKFSRIWLMLRSSIHIWSSELDIRTTLYFFLIRVVTLAYFYLNLVRMVWPTISCIFSVLSIRTKLKSFLPFYFNSLSFNEFVEELWFTIYAGKLCATLYNIFRITCNFASSSTNSRGNRSVLVEDSCPSLMKVGPSCSTRSRSQEAVFRLLFFWYN